MKYILETERFRLREMAPGDGTFMFRLNSDPEVIRFTGDLPFESIEEAEKFILAYSQYQKYGYGRWMVEMKDSNELCGFCGLKFNEDISETDVGFRFERKYWGKGFATETSLACMKFGFEELGLKRIIGRVAKENFASIRVLEKVGMKYWKDEGCGELPGYWYLEEIKNYELRITKSSS